MTADEANEVLAIVKRICPVILSSAINPRGINGTSLRRCVGMMAADYNMINVPTFVYAMCVALGLARRCGATVVTMDRVRKAALAEAPVSLPAVQTVLAIVRLALAAEARIIAYTTYRSRDEVDATAKAINAAFEQTSEIAADDLDAGTYMAIVGLHGDVVKHLADRGRQLPRVVNYSHTMVMPALRMAQREYGNPNRYQELIDQNRVVHPAFMPRVGSMLAV
jgi:prophage DNA circulation protein